MGSYRISIAGGEPLISNDFFPFVQYARSKGVDVSFTTNGTLITKEIITQLNDLQIRTITISLDGANEADNDLIRGKGNFNEVLKGIALLSEFYKGSVALRMTMMKHNIKNAEDFVRLAESLGCKKVKFNAMRLTGRASDNSGYLLSPSEYVNFVHSMELNDYNKVKVVLPLNPFQKGSYDYIEELGFGCVAGKDCITISPEGFVRPCSQLDFSYSDGNCKTRSILDIWENGRMFGSFRTLEGNDKCKSCKVYDKCRGGCRYRAIQEGDVNAIDPYCYIEHYSGRLSYDFIDKAL
jgi:radical SAM protein with 4Fe4S-binding SPASM domain